MVTIVLYGVGKLPGAVFLAYAYMSYLVCLLYSQTGKNQLALPTSQMQEQGLEDREVKSLNLTLRVT